MWVGVIRCGGPLTTYHSPPTYHPLHEASLLVAPSDHRLPINYSCLLLTTVASCLLLVMLKHTYCSLRIPVKEQTATAAPETISIFDTWEALSAAFITQPEPRFPEDA